MLLSALTCVCVCCSVVWWRFLWRLLGLLLSMCTVGAMPSLTVVEHSKKGQNRRGWGLPPSDRMCLRVLLRSSATYFPIVRMGGCCRKCFSRCPLCGSGIGFVCGEYISRVCDGNCSRYFLTKKAVEIFFGASKGLVCLCPWRSIQ